MTFTPSADLGLRRTADEIIDIVQRAEEDPWAPSARMTVRLADSSPRRAANDFQQR